MVVRMGSEHSSSTRQTYKFHLKHPVIRVGTECSGMEPLPWVFKRLGLLDAFQLVFSCEKDRHCRRLITQCLHAWGPESAQGDIKHIMLTDIMVRNPKDLPDHDLYVVGRLKTLVQAAYSPSGSLAGARTGAVWPCNWQPGKASGPLPRAGVVVKPPPLGPHDCHN